MPTVMLPYSKASPSPHPEAVSLLEGVEGLTKTFAIGSIKTRRRKGRRTDHQRRLR
jgi:hypothetical protein